LVVMALSAIHTMATNAPDLRCVSVAANGDITLTWIAPAIPGGATFNNYQVFQSNNQAGPYTLMATITNYATTNYTQTGANGNLGSVFYYMQTSYVSGTNSSSSDTLQSIFLSISNPGLGTADLSWNATHKPQLPSSTGIYTIYREFPAGTWTAVGTTAALNYNDTITVCKDSLNYRVEIVDQSGCTSISSVPAHKQLFKNIIPPQTPASLCASVDTVTGITFITWQPSSSGDTEWYIIYQLQGSTWKPIISTLGATTTSYSYPLSDPGAKSESYRLAAEDSCNNISIEGTIQSTMFATVTFNRCDSSNLLAWNRYLNLFGGVGGYRIYVSTNGGAFTLAGTKTPGDSTFIHTGLINSYHYCYYVEVYNTTGTVLSTSNKCCASVNLPKAPAFSYLRTASVLGNRFVTVRCFVDTSAGVANYVLKRANSSPGTYAAMKTLPFSKNITLTFIDSTAQVNNQSYFYEVGSMDSCRNELITTNVGRTVYLTATAEGVLTNKLAWNDYQQWSGPDSAYNIYRSIDQYSGYQQVASVPYSAGNNGYNTYTDDVSSTLQGQGNFYYYVAALEGSGDIYKYTDTSISNIAKAIQEPLFYVPNAFTPDGKNPVFIPVNAFVNATDYTFSIFDRWGEKVFETHDPSTGWDGTYQSKKANEGVYVYWIKYASSKGEDFQTKGTVTLLR